MSRDQSRGFSGSYDSSDVTFLLTPISMEPTETAERERLIQSGQRHYSEMIGREAVPSDAYIAAFEDALKRNQRRFAEDVVTLSTLIAEARPGPITIVSLARAGTPVGVLATRLLRKLHRRAVRHFSISIVRDRGIDANALSFVLQAARPEELVFLDGWTGKGVIARELARSLDGFEKTHGVRLRPELFVIADICGAAAVQVTTADYLIPSSILNATISGLVSRSILSSRHLKHDDFHGCLHLAELAAQDRSRKFVDEIESEALLVGPRPAVRPSAAEVEDRRRASARFVSQVRSQNGVADINHLKPGIGEATRVLLRRIPELVWVRDRGDLDVFHLLTLAREKGVRVIERSDLPYSAVALIRRVVEGDS